MNIKPYYKLSHSKKLRPFLESPIVAFIIHWIFQGLLYMDKTERLFKIFTDLLFTFLFSLILYGFSKSVTFNMLLLSFVLAHTMNFLFNAQVWVVAKHFRLIHQSKEAFDRFIQAFSIRLKNEPSIAFAAAYGSLVRGEWKTTSDLDIRVVRKKGIINGIRACLFILKERTRAFINRFPLDIYVFDNMNGLNRMSPKERPYVIFDEMSNFSKT